MKLAIKIVVHGQLYSKANSRNVGRNLKTGKLFNVKSPEAQSYTKHCIAQLKKFWEDKSPITCRIKLGVDIYHSSNRFDLDESLLMDCLQQSGVIGNDRQIMKKIINKKFDKRDPRCVIIILGWSDEELDIYIAPPELD